jgi:CheY-like chemotaxis protein
VLEAEDGVAALELLKGLDFTVDIVICDWEDPRVDGPRLAAEVNRLASARVDFIAHGDFDSTRRQQALARGASDAIGRPLRPELLLQKLVGLEKKRAGSKPASSMSQTGRFRLMQAEAPAEKPAPLSAHLWEALRRNCRHIETRPGTQVPVMPSGSKLWWVERGSVAVKEVRDDGIEFSHRAGAEEFVGEFAFGGGAYRSIEAVAESDCWLACQDADAVRRIIAGNAVLYYYFRNLSQIRARLYSRTGSPVEKGLSGNLESLKILDLLQVLNGARRTGILRLDDRDRTIFLQFAGGRIVHAETTGEIGEPVVYKAMAWTRGTFEFYVGPELPGATSVKSEMTKLLMRGAARLAGGDAR